MVFYYILKLIHNCLYMLSIFIMLSFGHLIGLELYTFNIFLFTRKNLDDQCGEIYETNEIIGYDILLLKQ